MAKRPEIMAPVGGQEQLLAAVRCGTDAVYLGGKGFNARRNAANFGETDLKEAVSYCHARGVKVYVTINTIVMDDEREALETEAREIAESGADAVIIQDFSVLRLFENRYPTLKRFASTQTAVHNVNGAKFLRDMGFQSIVLARELSLSEIERIASAVELPMEAFVHGAHCMSVSGACYLSAMFGGRSGNRGLCAQPCRLDWCSGSRHCALSLKDMSLLPHIRRMADVGVDFLKIEGRMKRPEYVAAAVTATRNAIEGKPYDAETLRAVFSRSGFTDGYITGKRGADMFGARTREDVVGAEKVFRELANLYRSETPRIDVDMRFAMDASGSKLTVTDGLHSITQEGEMPEAAQTRPLDAENARKNLTKLGGTPYRVRAFSAELQDGYTMRASTLNALRRDAIDRLHAIRGTVYPHAEQEYHVDSPIPYRTENRREVWMRFRCVEQMPEHTDADRILLPSGKVDEAVIRRFGERLTAQLPTVLFPSDEAAEEERIKRLRDAGLTSVYANNIYGIELGKRLGLTVYGGFGLNVINTEAIRAYREAGLKSITTSFELPMKKQTELGDKLPRGIIGYGHLPLMHLRNCPIRASVGCENCGGNGRLVDRMGVSFPVECGDKRYSMLLNSVPLDIAERLPDNFDYVLLYFTMESAREVTDIAARFRAGTKNAEAHTKGLYFRELL